MSEPYYSGDDVTLYLGDSLEVLRGLPDASIDCCVTSPPYFGLRDYGEPGQYGLESSPAEYVETMRALFAEVRRVLATDGTLWLNLGDSYQSSGGHTSQGATSQRAGRRNVAAQNASKVVSGLPTKNLLGIPWRTAFALQDDGWILRNDIIWSKPNAMPESVTDRLSSRHEHLFMFSRARTYWFDLDPIREPVVKGDAGSEFHTGKTGLHQLGRASTKPRERAKNQTPRHMGATDNTGWKNHEPAPHPMGRNPGDVWTVATQPFSEAHFAVMPQAIAERAILAGCKPSGTVLDPFSGSGTTGLAATKHGRKYVGIDLSRDYLDLSLRTRFAQPGLDFGGFA